jgi:2-oxoglutarate dehydrogenase E2 component (dihydrolipoamide succinyltransferase)
MNADPTGNLIAVRLPQTGTETAATLLEWKISVGDLVVAGDKLASAETEKTVVDIEAPVSGRVTALLVKPQDEITTDLTIAFIASDAAHGSSVISNDPLNKVPSTSDRTYDDLTVVAEMKRPVLPLPAAMRRASANLLWVTQNTARASTTVEVDFEAVAGVRSSAAGDFLARHGFRLTYLPFIAFAALRALREFPEVAARIDVDANTLEIPSQVHLGIAVARDAGLIVPVIRDADKLGFLALAKEIDGAAKKARAGLIAAADVLDGTFTISNPGVFGSYLSSPIMNRGESSILCVDAVERRAVVVGTDIVARLRAFLTLAFDHRVVDGMLALMLLGSIKATLDACTVSWILEDQRIEGQFGGSP